MISQKAIQVANFITLKAKPGKSDELAGFLTAGAAAVAASEAQTLGWYAVQLDHETFAIIDFFADKAGQDAHVNGQVAALLKAKADELIEGGWDDGVLKNFNVMKVLAGAS